MTFADAHIHLFSEGYPGRYGCLFPGGGEVTIYEACRQIHGIEEALVIGYEGEPWSVGNNAYLATLAREHAWMRPLAFCDLTVASLADRLDGWWKDGFVGISVYVQTESDVSALLDWSDEAVANLNAHRAIISVNVPASIAAQLRPVFARLGETRILLSHLGMPGPMSGAVADLGPIINLADLPQVGVKLSGAYACSAYPHPGLAAIFGALLGAYGDERLYWGSDFSPALDSVTFEQAIEAVQAHPWSNAQRIFCDNLKSIIRRVRVITQPTSQPRL